MGKSMFTPLSTISGSRTISQIRERAVATIALGRQIWAKSSVLQYLG
jgi:hypothetical protein